MTDTRRVILLVYRTAAVLLGRAEGMDAAQGGIILKSENICFEFNPMQSSGKHAAFGEANTSTSIF